MKEGAIPLLYLARLNFQALNRIQGAKSTLRLLAIYRVTARGRYRTPRGFLLSRDTQQVAAITLRHANLKSRITCKDIYSVYGRRIYLSWMKEFFPFIFHSASE